jgi:NADH dehydrogenase
VDVTLIDRRNFHLFQPLLYQVATGALSPGEIAAPIRGVLKRQSNTSVLLGEAVDIDPEGKIVILKDGSRVPYDSLIVATGSQSSFFGHNEWSEWSPPLKTIEDATMIRHKILLAFEAAERIDDPEERKKWLRFVIVGGGPTGVELAGALGEIANETLKGDFRSIRPSEAQILLIDGGSRLLATYPEELSTKAEQKLIDLGVRTRLGLMVTCVDGNGVTVKNKAGAQEFIPAHTVIWAAGVAITEFGKVLAERTKAETVRHGLLKVQPDLTIPGHPDIYVIGDLAYSTDEHGKPLPGVAQVAMQGGTYAAKTIVKRVKGERDTRPFKYFNKGELAVIGRGAAVANVFGAKLSGLLAWLVWVFIHLLYIVEFQSRILIAIEWGFLYLTHNRGALLITGHAAADSVAATTEKQHRSSVAASNMD